MKAIVPGNNYRQREYLGNMEEKKTWKKGNRLTKRGLGNHQEGEGGESSSLEKNFLTASGGLQNAALDINRRRGIHLDAQRHSE